MSERHILYEFPGFQLDTGQRILLRSGEPLALTPKVFDTLLFLLQNHGKVLDKDTMMEALWPESFVEEHNLSQNIFVLRKVLGEGQNSSRFIQTVPRRGYKFVAPVTETTADQDGVLAGCYWAQRSPFRGLQTFEVEDAWLFFGRDAETNDLLLALQRAPVLAVIGNSGCGKSSLIRAGLISALTQGRFRQEDIPVERWRVALVRPSQAPFDYLAESLPKQLRPDLTLPEEVELIAYCRQRLHSEIDAVRNVISALLTADDRASTTHVLLIVDQFEELYTLADDQQLRDRYIDALLAINQSRGTVPIHLVLILRADFYAACLEHEELSRCLQNNVYNVPRITREGLRQNIEQRLSLAGAHAEPGLIDSLIEDVDIEPGNLALLEHALGLLWEKCGGFGCTITNNDYMAIGRVRGALSQHADEVCADLANEQKLLVQKIFLELVHLADGENVPYTRRRVKKADLFRLSTPETMEALLSRLASKRLISTGQEQGEAFAEVSHEALIRQWSTLRVWVAQSHDELMLERRLLQSAREWRALAQDPGSLLRGSRLAQGEEWLAGHKNAHVLLCEFLQASVEARSESLRREREDQDRELTRQKTAAVRLRWFSCALIAFLALAIGSASFSLHQQIVEKSRALAARSGELVQRDHGQALELAIQSWHMGKTQEARLAVAKAFPELQFTLSHGGPITRIKFSPDGQRMLSASMDHSARIWTADGQLVARLDHTSGVMDVEFSPDGSQVLTVGEDHMGHVWSASDGRLLATLSGHTDNIENAGFSPDGKLIVTAGWDHTARIWQTFDGRLLTTLRGHSDKVVAAAFSPDGLHVVTASEDHTARVWRSADGHPEAVLQGHTGWVSDAEFFQDSRRIITTSWDGTARIWTIGESHESRVLRHSGPVLHVQFSPDGRHAVTASQDHTARAWDVEDGRLLFTLQHEGPVQQAYFSSDGHYIVTASLDETARVWRSTDGGLLAMMEAGDAVQDAVFSPDSRTIALANGNHTAQVWKTASAAVSSTLEGHKGYLVHAEFSHDGRRIVTVSQDCTAKLWNSSTGELIATLSSGPRGFTQARFSPDGTLIVTAGVDHTAEVWSGFDGRLLLTLRGHASWLSDAAFSPDNTRIITASNDGTGRIWSVDGRLQATLYGHTQNIWHASFSPDGQRIVTASDDSTARVWSSIGGQHLATLVGHTGPVWQAAFSPDGQRIVTAGFDHTARVWNAADGRLIVNLNGHSDLVDAAEFSSDGRRVLTASWDGTARVWDSNDGHLIAILRHKDKVISAAFSPDGNFILTASEDRTAQLFNTVNYQLVATLRGHSGGLWQAAFSPDNPRHIVTASLDQTGRVWRVLTLTDIESILKR